MKMTLLLLMSLTATLLLWSFINKPEGSGKASPSCAPGAYRLIEPDSVFVKRAASSGMMEVALGNLAQQKATHPRVKDFAAMMVRDHTASNGELMTLITRKNILITDSILPKDKGHMRMLNGLTGKAFDRAYMNMMVEAHKDDIDEFEDAAKKAQDSVVRAFAAKTLPLLIMHRDSARAVRRAIK